jgi:hypothetical protein
MLLLLQERGGRDRGSSDGLLHFRMLVPVKKAGCVIGKVQYSDLGLLAGIGQLHQPLRTATAVCSAHAAAQLLLMLAMSTLCIGLLGSDNHIGIAGLSPFRLTMH